MTSSSLCQLPTYISTHLPKIYIFSRVSFFFKLHQNIHIFHGDILVKFSCPDISNAVRELAKVNDGEKDTSLKHILRVVNFALDTCLKLEFKPKTN